MMPWESDGDRRERREWRRLAKAMRCIEVGIAALRASHASTGAMVADCLEKVKELAGIVLGQGREIADLRARLAVLEEDKAIREREWQIIMGRPPWGDAPADATESPEG